MLGDFGLGSTPEVDILIKAIDDTQGAFGSVGSGLGILTAAAAAATAVVVATGAAIVQVTKTTLAWGVSLHDTMVILGVTSQQAAGLTLAADASGVSIETLTGAVMRLDKGLSTANGKAGASAKVLDDLGIAWKNANGTMKDSTELLQSVADWFAKTTDVTARNNMELTIFGRSGAAVDDLLLNLAHGGMQQYIDQAQKFGLALNNDQISKIHEVSEQMSILQDAFKGAEVTLGVTFIPVLQNLVTWFEHFLAAEMPAITQFGQFLAMLTGASAINMPKVSTSVTNPVSMAGSGAAPVYGGGNSASDQAWRDYWNGKGPKPGSTGAYAPGGEYAGMQAANQKYNYADEFKGLQAANNKGGLGDLTKLEQSIQNFVTIIQRINWAAVGGDLNAFGGYINKAVIDIATASKNINMMKFDIQNGGGGELVRQIADTLKTTIYQLGIVVTAEAFDWFGNALVKPIETAITDNIKALADNIDTSAGILGKAIHSLGVKIMTSINDFLSILGLPAIGQTKGISNRAGGGSFSGWAMVGDAPGGGVTPFTEYVYAPHGATVYNQSQMSGHGAPPMAGGGHIGGLLTDADLRKLTVAFRDAMLKAK